MCNFPCWVISGLSQTYLDNSSDFQVYYFFCSNTDTAILSIWFPSLITCICRSFDDVGKRGIKKVVEVAGGLCWFTLRLKEVFLDGQFLIFRSWRKDDGVTETTGGRTGIALTGKWEGVTPAGGRTDITSTCGRTGGSDEEDTEDDEGWFPVMTKLQSPDGSNS